MEKNGKTYASLDNILLNSSYNNQNDQSTQTNFVQSAFCVPLRIANNL